MNKRQRKRLLFTGVFVLVFSAVLGIIGYRKSILSKKEAVAGTDKSEQKLQNEQTVGHITVTYLTLDSTVLDDIDEITEEINKITIPEIGTEVEFTFINITDSQSKFPLWIGAKKHFDLMALSNQDINDYINKKMVLPLDDLLSEYGKDICDVMEQGYELTQGATIEGKTYGISNIPEVIGNGGGLWIAKRVLEESGISYDPKHIYSLDELSNLFAALKKKYPNQYPLGQITSGKTYTTSTFFYKTQDALAASLSLGILSTETGKIENFYATKEYYDFLTWLRNCYEAGYIYPDSAITDADCSELIKHRIVLTWPLSSTPGIITESDFGEPVVCLRTTPVKENAQNSRSGFWTVPSTSQNPEGAMKFLNLLYHDTRISNLLMWGIEGEHYIITDEENGLIQYPEGKTREELGYVNPIGFYGDMRDVYSTQTASFRKQQQEYSKEARENRSEVNYPEYDSASMTRTIEDVQKVINTYVPALESGSVDIDMYYAEFLKKLDAAGINEILADQQKQYEKWQEEQSETR